MNPYRKRHEDITIRHYQPADEPDVKILFALGIMSNLNAAVFRICQKPINMALLASIAGSAFWVSNSWMVALLALSGSIGSIYYLIRSKFVAYVTESIQTDLSNISQVYYSKSRGCFLVAIDDYTSEIVGTVGLENKGNDIFELRRMSVDAQYRGQGIGRRLLVRLEQECQKGKITLGTSSFMYAAHALYKKSGYRLIQSSPLDENGWHHHFSNLELYNFEKEL